MFFQTDRLEKMLADSLSNFKEKMEEHIACLVEIGHDKVYQVESDLIARANSSGIIVGFLVLFTSLIFTDITVQNVPLTLFVVVMTAFLFSIAGFLNALFANGHFSIQQCSVYSCL